MRRIRPGSLLRPDESASGRGCPGVQGHGFDSKPIAGKGKLGDRATLATYQAENSALVANLLDYKIASSLDRRKLPAFLSRLKAPHQSPFQSKVLRLAASADIRTAN